MDNRVKIFVFFIIIYSTAVLYGCEPQISSVTISTGISGTNYDRKKVIEIQLDGNVFYQEFVGDDSVVNFKSSISKDQALAFYKFIERRIQTIPLTDSSYSMVVDDATKLEICVKNKKSLLKYYSYLSILPSEDSIRRIINLPKTLTLVPSQNRKFNTSIQNETVPPPPPLPNKFRP